MVYDKQYLASIPGDDIIISSRKMTDNFIISSENLGYRRYLQH